MRFSFDHNNFAHFTLSVDTYECSCLNESSSTIKCFIYVYVAQTHTKKWKHINSNHISYVCPIIRYSDYLRFNTYFISLVRHMHIRYIFIRSFVRLMTVRMNVCKFVYVLLTYVKYLCVCLFYYYSVLLFVSSSCRPCNISLPFLYLLILIVL